MAENNEPLFIALGIKPDADQELAVKTAGDLADLKRQVLAVTKTTTVADAVGAIAANVAAADRYKAAEAKLYEIEKKNREQDFDALVKVGDDCGKFPPALAKSEWAKALRESPDGVATLKSYLDRAPVLVNRKPIVEDPESLDHVELTASEIEVAKKMVGDDAVALKKRLDSLRTAKIEDMRSRKAAVR
jgi:hypothetical protein